jgi:hypothetical protein
MTTYTGYIVNNYGGIQGNNLDLSQIFAGITGTQPTLVSGFKISTGQDIGELFKNWDGSSPKASITGYTTNGLDLNQYFQLVIPFTTTGTGTTVQYTSGYYIVTFINSGTITFTKTVSNVSIICVGGGGGGGSGSSNFSNQQSGRGGGGGGNYQLTSQTLTNQIYNISVGTGGLGGAAGFPGSVGAAGNPGTTSSISTSTSSIILSCSGGGGGPISGNIGGTAGTVLTPSGLSVNGGAGGIADTSGYPSSSYSSPFSIPPVLSTYINSKYCGGGGGCNPPSNGGGSGYNGAGGILNGSNSKYGQNASTYGSGGGGASNNTSPNISNYSGGNGASGVVIIYFQYP